MNKPIFIEKGVIPFSETFHPEFDGFIGEVKDGVIISQIRSKEPGKGNFSKLLKELKAKYNWVRIPTPSNTMRYIATKKGFVSKEEYFPEPFDEWGEMLVWTKAVELK